MFDHFYVQALCAACPGPLQSVEVLQQLESNETWAQTLARAPGALWDPLGW